MRLKRLNPIVPQIANPPTNKINQIPKLRKKFPNISIKASEIAPPSIKHKHTNVAELMDSRRLFVILHHLPIFDRDFGKCRPADNLTEPPC